jgi:ABC-type multidrug transport system fused ATPase/permease subunit
LIIGISQVIRGVLQLGRNFGAELLAQKLERSVRDELYLSLLGKSMTFHNLQPVGDTMARSTNDVREVNYMFSPGINLVVGSLIFLLMPIFVAGRYHPSLVIVPVVYIILYFVALARYLKTLAPITDDVRATFGEMNTHLSESLDGVEVVKGASQENAEVDRFVMNASRVRTPSCGRATWRDATWPCYCSVPPTPLACSMPSCFSAAGCSTLGACGGVFRIADVAPVPHLRLHVCIFADLARAYRAPAASWN